MSYGRHLHILSGFLNSSSGSIGLDLRLEYLQCTSNPCQFNASYNLQALEAAVLAELSAW